MTSTPTARPAPSPDEVRAHFPALQRKHNGIPVAYFDGPGGTQVPLGEIADIRMTMGPSMISSENGLLRGTVLLNVRGRDVGGLSSS